MAESRPRELTPEELTLIRSSTAGGAAGTEPLRIPPGTQIAVELLNPVGERASNTSPTAGPPEGGLDLGATKAPSATPSSGKKKER